MSTSPTISSPTSKVRYVSSYQQVSGDEKPALQSTRNASESIASTVCNHWYFECLTLFVSLIAFASIVILLKIHEHGPLPHWPVGLTINSVVSICGALVKTGLLVPVVACISQLKWIRFREGHHPLKELAGFDGASRGPREAMKLLWRLKGRLVINLSTFFPSWVKLT